MFLEDHESSKASSEEEDDKVRFHLIRACACVVDVDVVSNGSKERNAM